MRILAVAFILSILFACGCTKKVAKIEAVPQEVKQPVIVTQMVVDGKPLQKLNDSTFILDTIVLPKIYFDFNSSTLRTDALETLKTIGEQAKERSVELKIEGHCDERGSVRYNFGLGQKRSVAVLKQLEALGVSPARMSAVSYGKSNPVRSCCKDEACHQQNRRVEFELVEKYGE